MSEISSTQPISAASGVTNKNVDKLERITYRFDLSLKPTDRESFNHFNWLDLVASEEKKCRSGPGGLDPYASDDDDQLRALANKFEQKYGGCAKKKKAARMREDYADAGYGYDSDDPFIDNSEAHDEIVPRNLTTAHGGFYINCGPLEFRQRESADDDSDLEVSSDISKRIIKVTDARLKVNCARNLHSGSKPLGRPKMRNPDGTFVHPPKKPRVSRLDNTTKKMKKKIFRQEKKTLCAPTEAATASKTSESSSTTSIHPVVTLKTIETSPNSMIKDSLEPATVTVGALSSNNTDPIKQSFRPSDTLIKPLDSALNSNNADIKKGIYQNGSDLRGTTVSSSKNNVFFSTASYDDKKYGQNINPLSSVKLHENLFHKSPQDNAIRISNLSLTASKPTVMEGSPKTKSKSHPKVSKTVEQTLTQKVATPISQKSVKSNTTKKQQVPKFTSVIPKGLSEEISHNLSNKNTYNVVGVTDKFDASQESRPTDYRHLCTSTKMTEEDKLVEILEKPSRLSLTNKKKETTFKEKNIHPVVMNMDAKRQCKPMPKMESAQTENFLAGNPITASKVRFNRQKEIESIEQAVKHRVIDSSETYKHTVGSVLHNPICQPESQPNLMEQQTFKISPKTERNSSLEQCLAKEKIKEGKIYRPEEDKTTTLKESYKWTGMTNSDMSENQYKDLQARQQAKYELNQLHMMRKQEQQRLKSEEERKATLQQMLLQRSGNESSSYVYNASTSSVPVLYNPQLHNMSNNTSADRRINNNQYQVCSPTTSNIPYAHSRNYSYLSNNMATSLHSTLPAQNSGQQLYVNSNTYQRFQSPVVEATNRSLSTSDHRHQNMHHHRLPHSRDSLPNFSTFIQQNSMHSGVVTPSTSVINYGYSMSSTASSVPSLK